MASDELITVVIACGASLLAHGLSHLLSGEPDLVAQMIHPTGPSLERFIVGRKYCVVVLDDMVEHALLRRLKLAPNAPGMIVVTHTPTRLHGTLLLELGVSCIAYDALPEAIVSTIYRASERRTSFVSSDGSHLEPHRPRGVNLLTPRERDVVEHLSMGRSPGEIGLALNISPETVRTHTAKILRKMGLARKRELIGTWLPANRGEAESFGTQPRSPQTHPVWGIDEQDRRKLA